MPSHPTGADSSSFWLCVLVLTGQLDEPEPENVKQVELRVPRTAALQCVWSFSDFSPYRLLSLSARLFGCTSPSLWMLSVCLAEIEKHKGNRFYRNGVECFQQYRWDLLISLLCHQGLESSQLRLTSLLGLRSLCWCRAEWRSSFGRRPNTRGSRLPPKASASTCSNMEATYLTWWDWFLGLD